MLNMDVMRAWFGRGVEGRLAKGGEGLWQSAWAEGCWSVGEGVGCGWGMVLGELRMRVVIR